MATLEEIFAANCPCPNIVCWARQRILQRLMELHDFVVSIRSLNPIPMKRLICGYLGDDIDAMLEKICSLEDEVCSDNIVTEELECFIIEYITSLTVNEPFDENTQRLGVPNFFYDTYRSKIT